MNITEKQKKILMLVPTLRIGSGVASFAIAYFRKLDHKTIQMDFACYYKKTESYADEIESFGSKVFYLPPLKHFVSHCKTCIKIAKEGEYNIIHNCSLINTIPMMIAAKKYIKKRILHSHSSKLGETKFKALRNGLFLPFLRSLANEYVACSDLAARRLFGNKKYTLIPNVIDGTKFAYNEVVRQKVRKEMNAETKLIIGSVGRGAPQKNPIRALQIIREVVKLNPNIEYWWVGSGPLLEEMQAFVKQNTLENNIKILGNRNDVADLYQAMDVFFMPSRFEGLGISCVEAQVAGLPCIVSDVIPKEVAFTNLVDFISLSKDDKCWAEKLLKSFEKSDNRRSFFPELGKSVFYNETAGSRLESYYKELCKNV